MVFIGNGKFVEISED